MTRVLVVDDEIDTLNLLRTILEISGYQAFTTLNSVEAIMMAEVERPDCVLLDIMMPQLDGFTLCKMMRLHPATKNLPIVFVTAYSALDIEERRLEAGADMVLPKPIGMDVLIEAVEKAMALRTSKTAEVKVIPEIPISHFSTTPASPQPVASAAPQPVSAVKPEPPVKPEQPTTEAKPVSTDKPAVVPVPVPQPVATAKPEQTSLEVGKSSNGEKPATAPVSVQLPANEARPEQPVLDVKPLPPATAEVKTTDASKPGGITVPDPSGDLPLDISNSANKEDKTAKAAPAESVPPELHK